MQKWARNSKPIDVAILVSSEYYDNNHPDDLALQSALRNKGHSAEIIAWDDCNYDFNQVKFAIVRSCWDYDNRLDEFLDTMSRIQQKCILLNKFETIQANSNKYYLADLESKGIPIVPTEFIKHSSQVLSALSCFETEQVIVKPVISASGRNTYRMNRDDVGLVTQEVEELLRYKDVMIQPYINTIEIKGEKSTVVIDGQPVYTMLKKPAEGNFLVHMHRGGTYVKGEADLKDQALIRQVLDVLPEIPIYMRVDYLFDSKGSPMLLELELIEPNLYLSVNEHGLRLLTNRLTAMINSMNALDCNS